jgi:hypothetical protein
VTSSECDAWFAVSPESQKQQLNDLRKLILALEPEVVEEYKWSRPCYFNARGMFCYVLRNKGHVTLGFQNGAEIDDPSSLLEGTGKSMRHVKIKPGMDVNHLDIIALLRASVSS